MIRQKSGREAHEHSAFQRSCSLLGPKSRTKTFGPKIVFNLKKLTDLIRQQQIRPKRCLQTPACCRELRGLVPHKPFECDPCASEKNLFETRLKTGHFWRRFHTLSLKSEKKNKKRAQKAWPVDQRPNGVDQIFSACTRPIRAPNASI